MDIFVPIMFLAALLLGPILLLSGVWILVKKIRRQGWSSVVPRFAGWNRFWFTPADPTVLGLIRIGCGAITTYTVFAYSFTLQDYMGEHAWYDLPLRMHWVKTRISDPGRLDGRFYPFAEPANETDKKYQQDYKKRWGVYPPPPFPINAKQADDLNYFRIMQNIDVRHFGLNPPIQDGTGQDVLQPSDPNRPRLAEYEKYLYVKEYMEHPANILRRPPPAYPSSIKEKDEIFAYMAKNSGVDPRLHFYTGQPVWSLWFDVTDPAAMMVVHVMVILVCFLFTIGFCTRITSALTWITSLWYIHRSTIQLFGVDTMMMIVLLYLMIGPSGSALSVDRLMRAGGAGPNRAWSMVGGRSSAGQRWRPPPFSRPLTARCLSPACRRTLRSACSRYICALSIWSPDCVSFRAERGGREPRFGARLPILSLPPWLCNSIMFTFITRSCAGWQLTSCVWRCSSAPVPGSRLLSKSVTSSLSGGPRDGGFSSSLLFFCTAASPCSWV